MNNFPIIKNTTPSTSEKNLNFINEMISNTLFNRKTNGEINLHEFSSKAKTFRSYDKFLDTNELDAEKLKEIKAFMNSVDKLEPIRDGLICWLDGRDGNNNDRTTIWKDRSGNGNDATLVGFDFNENSGWGDGCLIFKKPSDPLQLHNYVKLYSNITNLHVHVTLDRANSTLNNKTEYVFDSRINDESTSGFCILKLGSDEFIKASRNCKESFLDSSKLVGNNLPTSKTYTKAPFTISFNLTSADINPKFIGKRYMPANSNIEHIDMKLYTLLLYDRTLTTEEIRHNYLYDLSVQYLLKNQINSNTIETYYDFDPNYDLPDNRIEGCLMVSNGRLVYYNPSGSAPLRIANNKTLDECIVEETEDYIIYSDGEVTPDNPIPEGIYFACRVDKHTGEIYYGEGYENYARNMLFQINRPTPDRFPTLKIKNSLNIDPNGWHYTEMYGENVDTWYVDTLVPNNGGMVVENIKAGDKFYVGLEYKLQKPYTNNFRYEHYIYHQTPSLNTPISKSKLIKNNTYMWEGLTTSEAELARYSPTIVFRFNNKHYSHYLFSFIHRVIFTKGQQSKPYVRVKCPASRLYVQPANHIGTSFLIKDLEINRAEHFLGVSRLGHLYFNNKEGIILNKKSDLVYSNNFGSYQGSGVRNDPYTIPGSTYLRINGKYQIEKMKAFIFYKGDLTQAELEAEKNKTFKLKKLYRTNSNQSSFLGLEDIFTNNNTKEIIDGTIIDTTKTPIEYKEQKDISKTSDITSYTKNNINIEKSKCGYIRDIRNTNDFKNLPNNLVAEPSKYDEKYQSPTVNIVRVIDDKYGFGYGYNNTDGANVTIDNQILKTVIKNKNKSINSYPLTLIRQNSTSYIGKTLSVSFLIKGVGTTFVDIHQIRSDTGQNSVGRGRTIELTDEYTRYTISNFICNESHQNMAITVGNTVDIIEIKDIQVELSPVATDYTPPNSDGNFVPTIGESGIFSVKQTTKDTDKNTNTFARTIFLP